MNTDEKATEQLQIRVTPTEKQAFKSAFKNLSETTRNMLNEAVRRQQRRKVKS